ncbi:MAG: protein phosphatase 2C domain-containing protein [Bdellovibrionales bacterium]|nr:protein phosphatase 2C domain-containing protein [Bdellovibrionales bacterium]
MKRRSCGHTDKGTVREDNQDSLYVDEEMGLYIVCDGMGGYAAGEVASQTAVEVISEHIKQYKKNIPRTDDFDQLHIALATLLQDAVSTACQKILKLVEENQNYAGMGTTMTLLLIHGNKGVMGHVGDSKLYLYRRNRFHQLNRDHTLANRLLSEGVISPDELATSPVAHVLTRAIGRQESVSVDTLIFDLVPGDCCLLCSDGFSNAFDNTKEFADLLPVGKFEETNDPDFKVLAEALVDTAVARDGSDNTTAILVSFEEGEGAEDEKERSEDVYLKIDTLKKVYLFEDLSLQEILTVMENVKVLDCKAGSLVVKEGHAGDSMFVILAGGFDVTRASQKLAELGPGMHFGEIALISQEVRTANVVASVDSRLLVMEREGFEKLLRAKKDIGISLLRKLAEELSVRLARTNEKLQQQGES